MKNVGNSSRGRSQGVPKIFRAPTYRAHCAVIFAIAQLWAFTWSSSLTLHIEIYTTSRDFPATHDSQMRHWYQQRTVYTTSWCEWVVLLSDVDVLPSLPDSITQYVHSSPIPPRKTTMTSFMQVRRVDQSASPTAHDAEARVNQTA